MEKLDFSLSDLVESMVSSWRLTVEDMGLGFTLSCICEGVDRLRGDPIRLRQILGNFISNAVKFTAIGGVDVEVDATPAGEDGAEVSIRVRDSGIGIDDEAVERLFNLNLAHFMK